MAGVDSDAMPSAMLSDSAMTPTVRPDRASCLRSSAVYFPEVKTSSSLGRKMGCTLEERPIRTSGAPGAVKAAAAAEAAVAEAEAEGGTSSL